MFFDARDVVAETQPDFDMLAAADVLASEPAASSSWRRRRRPRSPPVDSPTTAALMRPGALPALSLVVLEEAAADASAMQRLRLQTPRAGDDAAVTPTRCWTLSTDSNDGNEGDVEFVGETPAAAATRPGKRPRSASPASSVGSAGSACASAVALARKRALKESVWHAREDAHEAVEETTTTASLDYDGDDEEHSPRVTSFVEYDAAELDHLVIAPSQDYFDADDAAACEASEITAPPPPPSTQQTPCGFVDFRDLTQWNDESSEVFDDVISAPRCPTPLPAAQAMPSIREQVHASPRDVRSPTPSSATPPSTTTQEDAGERTAGDAAARDKDESDSESSLSDGFDISRAIGSAGNAKAAKLQRRCRARMPPQSTQQAKVQWRERRSVKRDCSFIENQCASPASDKIHRARAVSRIEELHVEIVDSSDDDCDEPTKFELGDDDELTTLSASATPATNASSARSVFQPRVLKKRRKARQLGLDAFFRSRPCM